MLIFAGKHRVISEESIFFTEDLKRIFLFGEKAKIISSSLKFDKATEFLDRSKKLTSFSTKFEEKIEQITLILSWELL